MDVNEQKYRKTINSFRTPISNIIYEYPISDEGLSNIRNLKYLVTKQRLSVSLPYENPIFEDSIEEIKTMLQDNSIQKRMLGLRLARALPFIHRVKFIETSQNELMKVVSISNQNNQQASPKKGTIVLSQASQFHYEITSDMSELCLSIYEITHFSDDIYFDINQRILTLYQKLSNFQNIFHNDKNIVRNCYQALRSLFLSFGFSKKKVMEGEINTNKLISKVVNILVFSSSFVATNQNKSLAFGSTTPRQKLRSLIMHTRQFQIRVRSRLLVGLSYLITYLEDLEMEIFELLSKQVFIILQNNGQCDVQLDCFASLKALLSIKVPFYIRNQIVKKWTLIMNDINYKKQYWEYFIQIAKQINSAPLKLKYNFSIFLLQSTRNVQKQFSRFLLYKQACRNLMQVARVVVRKQEGNILLNIFLHGWFIDRINQENDLFRSQFLISLLHAFFQLKGNAGIQEVQDLLGLCHRLLDWKCSCKQETHIPTIKFSFDLYLMFLKKASQILGESVEVYISQLIQRCNQQNIYFLFKLKLVSTLIKLPWYRQHWKYTACKLNLQFLEGQIRPFMMPKNPKPIFDFVYSRTQDGQIQSRKQIDCIKIIMGLLTSLPQVHEIQSRVSAIAIDYNNYLNDLQSVTSSNKDLINCLLTLEADHFFSQCQRNFLLSIIQQTDCRGNNYEYTLSENIVYSPYEQFYSEEDINVFGTMSPIQLTLRVLPHPTYSSVYLQLKKSQWVSVDQLKLVVSSGVQKKELPFQSCIIEMKIDRIGALHFEVWRCQGGQMLLGSGKFKLKRNLRWRKMNHLSLIDGIRSKAYFKNPTVGDGTYLSYYYGEPIIIQAVKSCNQVVVTLSNRQVWNQMQESVVQMVEELTDGTANVINL